MMSKEKDLLNRFGSNLAESMGAGRTSSPPVQGSATMGKHDGVSRLRTAAEIEVGRIVADPDQPRTEFDPDAIARLAESIKAHGQIQPISVRWSNDVGRYLIVTGERRWRASILAGQPTIAAVIVEGERSESQIREAQLIENCLREDLKPIEQAKAFRNLMDLNGWSAARLAESLQLTGASVSRALALLGLPYTVQDAVASGQLAPSVAYEVSKIESPATQREVAERIVSEGLNRAETVEVVRQAADRNRDRISRGSPGKGRGAKLAKPAKLPTERTVKTSSGMKVVVMGRKGFDVAAWVQALEEAARIARAKLSDDGQDQVAA